MSTVTEQTGTAAWILAQIGADATITALSGWGGAYELLAPKGVTTPYVIAQCQSALDMQTANGHRVLSDQVWLIKAIAPMSQYSALNTIAIRLDALFGDKRQAGDSNVVVSAAVRESEVNYAEVVGDQIYKHLGGTYRLQVWLA
jgi:hypothetical protein